MKKLFVLLIIPFLSFGQWYDYDICVYANISVGSCDSLSNGQINLEVAGGVPPYMYVVEPCGNFTDCLGNLSPGNYNITVIDTNGCTVSGDVEVCDPCESGICSEGFTYSDSFCGNDCELGCTDPSACNYNPDAIEDDGSCQYSPTPIEFTTFSLLDCCPNPSVIGITDLTAFGGTPPYNYTWQYQNGIIIADGPNETFIEVVAAGNYIITVTDALGCSQQSTISIDPNCFNEVTFYTSDADCNENNGYIEIDISFGEPEYNTVLGSADGQIISGQSSGGWVEFENLAPGQYFFSTQDANGCLMAGDEIFFEIFEINCDESCDTVYIEVPVIEYIDCDTGLPCTSGMAEIIEKSKTNGKLYNLLGQEVFRREGIYIEGGEIKYRF